MEKPSLEFPVGTLQGLEQEPPNSVSVLVETTRSFQPLTS